MRCRIAGLLLCFCAVKILAAAPAIIPLPQLMQTRPGVFTLCPAQPVPGVAPVPTTKILVDSASVETGQYLAGMLLKSTGCRFQVQTNPAAGPFKGAILLTTVNALPTLGAEGYELTVAPDSVVIRAPAQAGAFYGVQSLLQLLPPQILSPTPVSGVPWTAPCVYIQDQPRFPWRGWMLDVVRHFFNKQEVEQALDAMALHKLNTFHWHLVDDQGWRIEILKYPFLTQNSAWRQNINLDVNIGRYPSMNLNSRSSTAWSADGHYGGYYTQADIREVVAYAQQRHITIVPEIEMPGHSTAALAAYPQYSCAPSGHTFDLDNISYTYDVYSPGTPGTFQFLQDVLTEVMALFPGQYIHCGGDEVSSTLWKTYPADMAQMQALGIDPTSSSAVQSYQHWFTTQMANFLQSHGRKLVGWTEIEYGGILTNAVCMDWLGSQATPTAQARQYVVRTPSPTCYFDNYENLGVAWTWEPVAIHSTTSVSLNTVYNFEPMPSGLAAQYASYILGAQGNLWCEFVPSLQNVEFRAYPRLCAMAEVTWTPAASKNYTDFTSRLTTHFQRLAQMGVNYNHSALPPQIAAWTQSQITSSTSYFPLQWNISTALTNRGEVDVVFSYTTGGYALDIQWAALLENGVEIDRDTHAGSTGASQSYPLYVLHLPWRKPGATYTLQASVKGHGGTASNGVIYLTNWD